MSKIPLHTQVLVGLLVGTVAGLVAGFFWGGTAPVEWVTDYLARPVGQIFLRLLLMVVVPLVFATLVLGIAGLGDPRRLGSMGVKTLAFFLGMCSFLAVSKKVENKISFLKKAGTQHCGVGAYK